MTMLSLLSRRGLFLRAINILIPNPQMPELTLVQTCGRNDRRGRGGTPFLRRVQELLSTGAL